MFTARTTGVSNPFRDPSLHPSLSDPYLQSAFAIVSLTKINTFYRYLGHTLCIFRSLVLQYLLHDSCLRHEISQETDKTSYECFRPNKCGCNSDRRYYRGGWHRSCPVLIRLPFYSRQKILIENHSGLFYHTFVHCKISSAAAPRRTRNSV